MKNFYIVTAATLLGLSPVASQAQEKVNFVRQVKPILDAYCVSCHSDEKAEENETFSMTTKKSAMAGAFEGGEYTKVIVPGEPDKSTFYTRTILPADSKKLMPPVNKGGPLPKDVTDLIKRWIAEGAEWPDQVELHAVRRIEFARDVQPLLLKGGPFESKDKETLRLWTEQGTIWPEGVKLAGGAGGKDPETLLVEELHKMITSSNKVSNAAEMKPYADKLSDQVTFEMLPIPGGEFVMGSPEGEAKSKPDEHPQHKVKIDPFWMGKCEITWDEYEMFQFPDQNKLTDTTYKSEVADATARPTKPYVEMSFGMGKGKFPAISMTQHAANKYCQWLSAKTGHFYRLPTEAEWEYACRAGTTTAYSFGDDASKIDEYAWYADNSNFKYQLVGKKKPNPWGLHDMHGNVAEWTLDGYNPNFYMAGKDSLVSNPYNRGTKPYPHVARGGSWDDDVDKLRSAARRASNPSWKQQDPQLPKSIWFLTDAMFLGFRVVRPLKVPSPEEMHKYWNNGVETE